MWFQTLLQWTASISGTLSLVGSSYVLLGFEILEPTENPGAPESPLHAENPVASESPRGHAESSGESRSSSDIIRTTCDLV